MQVERQFKAAGVFCNDRDCMKLTRQKKARILQLTMWRSPSEYAGGSLIFSFFISPDDRLLFKYPPETNISEI